VFCFGQSTSDAAIQHQQAVQQLQQQQPKAVVVDVAALTAAQQQEQSSCSSCAQKTLQRSKAANSNATNLASEADLMAKCKDLVATIENLRQANPIDKGLIAKYNRALELATADLKTVTAQKERAARTAEKIRQAGQ
jgi:hypothetical protein